MRVSPVGRLLLQLSNVPNPHYLVSDIDITF